MTAKYSELKLIFKKKWPEIKRRVGTVIPVSTRKEVLQLLAKMKTNKAGTFQLNESGTDMSEKQQFLNG